MAFGPRFRGFRADIGRRGLLGRMPGCCSGLHGSVKIEASEQLGVGVESGERDELAARECMV